MTEYDNTKTIREPFVRVAKRGDIKRSKSILLHLSSVLFALFLGGIFILAIGKNPFAFYTEVLLGCFKNKIYFFGLIRMFMPLVITAIGISYAFKMRYWNIGAEGQFIIGAICATAIGLFFGESLPHWLVIVLMFLAGAVGAGIYGLITAIFKVQFGTNETLLTLMFNYIALYIVHYLTKVNGFRVEGSRPSIKILPSNAWLDQVFGIDITIFFCIFIVLFTFIYFKYTKQGYEISIVGESKNTARYAGMNVKKIMLRTMFLSSAIVGMAGMFQATGHATGHRLTVGITGGVGWTAIIVAWLAKLNPFGILAVSILMSILSKGAEVANSSLGISTAVSDILQGIILFSVLAFEFFISYRIIFRQNKFTDAIKGFFAKFVPKTLCKSNVGAQEGQVQFLQNGKADDITKEASEVIMQDNLQEDASDTQNSEELEQEELQEDIKECKETEQERKQESIQSNMIASVQGTQDDVQTDKEGKNDNNN